MGEYIKDTKLGTCENLYYTTFPALKKTKKFSASEKLDFLKLDSGYRFRFPFPDEANIAIGMHDDYDRGFLLDIPNNIGVEMNHDAVSVQGKFGGYEGVVTPRHYEYKLHICCPQHEDAKDNIHIKKSEYLKDRLVLEIVQQKYTTKQGAAMLVTVVRCPYCRQRCQLSKEEVQSMVDYFQDQKDRFKEAAHDKTIEILTIALSGYSYTETETVEPTADFFKNGNLTFAANAE